MEKTLALACELIRRPSVTPADAGCQALMMERLAALGFRTTALRFGEVDNFWAVRGDSGPILVFAGHTDVVPTGPLEQWRSPPFEPTLRRWRPVRARRRRYEGQPGGHGGGLRGFRRRSSRTTAGASAS